jgi:hypothetical protein
MSPHNKADAEPKSAATASSGVAPTTSLAWASAGTCGGTHRWHVAPLACPTRNSEGAVPRQSSLGASAGEPFVSGAILSHITENCYRENGQETLNAGSVVPPS